jgi:LDH2 family malate/lactate/ureidoglycolate dehydrogenase
MLAWGAPEDAARTTADVMVDTDLSGIDSHGVGMLHLYDRMQAEGELDLITQPKTVTDMPAFAVVDACHGLGHPVGIHAMTLAIEKARACGIGAVAVRNSHHFGAVGYYVRLAAAEGLLGMATTTTRTPVVAATGGTTPVLGTNPIAFAAPREGGEPLVVDISTSVVAMNKVKAYSNKGLDLPLGWLSDREGNPVTDATAGYRMLTTRGGTLSPLGGPDPESGGHKGFGLSLLSHILSAALSNAAPPGHGGERDNIGHFFLAVDAELVNPGGLTPRNIDELLRSVQDGEPGVVVPGEPELRARAERGANGVPIPEALMTQITEVAGRAGVPVTMTPL